MQEQRTLGNTIFNVLNIGFFAVFTLICIFPFYYLIINTFSDNHLASTGQILFYPKGFHLQNYFDVLKIPGLRQAAMISISRTVIGTALTLLGCTLLGYAFSKREYWMRKFWYRFIVVSMYFNAGLIPWFLTVKTLGLYNNFLIYVLPSMVSGFYIILFKTYVEQLPPALEESAQIDGAGYVTRFTKIVLPLSAPIIATIAVFASVDQWNSFTDTLFLVRDAKLYTLQFILYQYLNEVQSIARMMRSSIQQGLVDPSKIMTPTSIRMTVSVIVVLPIMLVYPFLQRYFVKGLLIGAVKG